MRKRWPATMLRILLTLVFAVTASLSIGFMAPAAPTAHAAVDPCSYASTNPIPCENTNPGTDPSISGVNGGDSTNIMGFSTDISVNHGGTISFKINASNKSYTIAIFRIGYYQGMGARQVATVTPTPSNQPACLTVAATGLIDCGNWSVNATWAVPSTAVSGIYYALLTDSLGNQSHIPFIVRNDASTSDIAFKTNDTTWAAYNDYGGNSLYYGNAPTGCGQSYSCGRAYKVSYNRPFNLENEGTGYGSANYVWYAEYPMVRWLESNGYNVSYISSIDVERSSTLLRNHKVILSAGHDEYWSAGERAAMQNAAAAGVNIVALTGNASFWKTRWENSIDGTNTAYRTLVSYKETVDNQVEDPLDPPTWTGTWRDPRFSPPADGGRPENGLLGTIFAVNSGTATPVISANFAKLRLWRNTPVASLTGGQTATLGVQTIGYEWDVDSDNGFRPAGLFDAAATSVNVSQLIQDYGNTYAAGTAIWGPTLYRVAGGGLVFSTGTVQWAWGLDTQHSTDPDTGPASPSVPMEQATVNILADMQAQPATIQSGLVQASASTDTAAPSSTITSPAAGASLAAGTTITISGSATDTGGGVVAGMEVSTDGGSTWHKANMSSAATSVTWSYSWTPLVSGSITIKSRAVDDSANLETPSAGVTVTVPSRTCPCTLFPSSATPATVDSGDANAVELGVRFTADVAGSVTGIKFYKSSANTGTHTGSLWSASGTLLATGTFTNETASGWQTLTFASPVAIQANTPYIASYHTAVGDYSTSTGYFNSQYDASPLHAPASNSTNGNGVYAYGASQFPSSSFSATNYWVDVVFSTSTTISAPAVTSTSPAANATGVALNTNASAQFNENVTSSSIQFTLTGPSNQAVAGTTSYNGTTFTATFTPSAALAANTTYTATVSGATDANGHTMAAPYVWTFTTSTTTAVVPTVTSVNPAPNATGVALTAAPSAQFNENVTSSSILFTLTGPSSQTVPGAVTYNNTTFTVTFTPSAALAANTTYTATVSGATDGSGHTMAAPYSWSFTTSADLTAPSVTATAPGANATGVGIATSVSATFDKSVTAASIQFTLTGPSSQAVGGTVSYNGTNNTVTFTPSATLASGTAYTATVSGATSQAGVAMAAPYTWTFTTVSCPCTLFAPGWVPANVTANDANAVELGMKFTADVSGYIAGVRFYKGPSNTGTHIGSLWTSTGTLLARVTFSGESASGWQQAIFSSNVAITAGTTYVVSYHTVSGFYSYTSAGFTNGIDNGDLHAPSSTAANGNGVYAYGANQFPTGTYNATNYWVDVVFTTANVNLAPPSVTSVSPTPNTAGVPVSASASVTFDRAVVASSITFTLMAPNSQAVAGTVTYNATTFTATLQPSAALAANSTYTATVSGATTATGGTMNAPYTWSFTTVSVCPCSVFPSSSVPGTVTASDASSVELGMKFKSDVSGHVTGVRFYKGPSNTGTHTGSLWTSTGTLLAQVTFTNETASGWQQATFSTPVAITAGTVYVVSYHTPVGFYSADSGYFSSGFDNPPLHALANSTSPNGVYLYGNGGFPTNSYNASNYWVDVVFTTT